MMTGKLVVAVGVATWAVSAVLAFDLATAKKLYDEQGKSPDYVFLDVRWTVSEDTDSDEADQLEMSAIMDAMNAYVKPPPVKCKASPFCPELTEWMIPDVGYTIPEVESAVVKTEDKEANRRRVIAFDGKLLNEVKMKAQEEATEIEKKVNGRSEADWAQELKNVAGKFKTAKQKSHFNKMLGCTIVDVVRQSGAPCDDESKQASEWSLSVDRWEKIGDGLKAEGAFKDAVVAYSVSIRKGNDKPTVWLAVAECCEKLGLKRNAAGLKWYAKMEMQK